MVKWADYLISEVRYDTQHSHIVKVKVHVDDGGDNIGTASEWSRSEVVAALKRSSTFITITKNSEGKFQKGQDVHIIKVNGVEYLRTDQNSKAADNLGNLPEF
jgi:hypothetical protein